MPQAVSVSASDRESTPVVHTFAPEKMQDGVWTFREFTSVPLSDNLFTVSSRRSSGKIRTQLRLKNPVVQTETLNGISAPKLVRTGYINIEIVVDETSSLQERKNLVGVAYNLMGATQTNMDLVLTGGQQFY